MKDRFKDAHVQVASVYSQLSRARRLKVGAIVLRGDSIISYGYNGTPPGEDNNCEIEPENWDGDIGTLKTKPNVIHAEDNALRKLVYMDRGEETINAWRCTMVITHAPCIPCAQKIVDAGIEKVIYSTKYRDESGIRYLEQHGIEVEQWQTKTSTLSATPVKQSSQSNTI